MERSGTRSPVTCRLCDGVWYPLKEGAALLAGNALFASMLRSCRGLARHRWIEVSWRARTPWPQWCSVALSRLPWRAVLCTLLGAQRGCDEGAGVLRSRLCSRATPLHDSVWCPLATPPLRVAVLRPSECREQEALGVAVLEEGRPRLVQVFPRLQRRLGERRVNLPSILMRVHICTPGANAAPLPWLAGTVWAGKRLRLPAFCRAVLRLPVWQRTRGSER